LAAAKAGNEQALNHGLAAIYRAGALFLTNYENFVAESGDYAGTEINSDRMLWSMAGNLAMVHRIFMGIQLEADGIRFAPAIPAAYKGKKQLSNFKYRSATLTIDVNGTGNKMASILLDGKPLANAFLPANITGAHVVTIEMDNQPFDKAKANFVVNKFSLPEPQVTLADGALSWKRIEGAKQYCIYKNGLLLKKISETSVLIADTTFAEYKVSAIDANGYESFTSEPVLTNKQGMRTIELEKFAAQSSLPYVNYSGSGFVEISNTVNQSLQFTVEVPADGQYMIDVKYSNGSGPWNTDNKCAIRSLYVNSSYAGSMVFPQRGKDEWSDWGYSNARIVTLKKGMNLLKLVLELWNINMNVDVNTAMLDMVRLQKLP